MRYSSFGSPQLAAIFLSAALASCLSTLGCAGVKQQSTSGSAGTSGSANSAGSGNNTGSGGTGVVMPQPCNGPNGKCTDFEPPTTPMNPMFATGVQTTDAGKFGTPSGTGPCVSEPETGTLFPNNWLRPRVRVPGNTGVMKITFHADMETMDLVVYASGEHWELPKDIWMALAKHIVGQDISVTVQLPTGGTTTVAFQVAPVGAGGSMVFWSIDPKTVGKNLANATTYPTASITNDSYLDAFTVGDESTVAVANGVPALSITDIDATKNGQPTINNDGNTRTNPRCIGCHVGTPDGNYVAFNDFWPWSVAFASVKPGANNVVGQALSGYPGATCTNWNTCTGSKTYVQEPWAGPVAFSETYWTSDGSQRMAVMVSQLPDPSQPWSQSDKAPGQLVWLDLNSTATGMTNGVPVPTSGTAWGILQHGGDHGSAAFPTWSNDGNTIVYSSSTYPSTFVLNNNDCNPSGCATPDLDGRLNQGTTDLYSIPFNSRSGGPATKLTWSDSTATGTPSDANRDEYYAGFSPDGKLVNFTAVPTGQIMYANAQAELFVNAFGTTTARRMRANDPPKCSGLSSPGVNNHWGKWSPDAQSYGGETYYWLIFSSNRYGLPMVTASNDGMTAQVQVSQLYITAVKTDEVGNVTTYPAIYLWNQPQSRMNNTPAWQNFHVRIIVN